MHDDPPVVSRYEPGAQTVQLFGEIAPVIALKVPIGHPTQEVDPVVLLYVPAPQLVQLDAPVEVVNVPTGQDKQSLAVFEPTTIPYEPAAHPVQELPPVVAR